MCTIVVIAQEQVCVGDIKLELQSCLYICTLPDWYVHTGDRPECRVGQSACDSQFGSGQGGQQGYDNVDRGGRPFHVKVVLHATDS